MCILKSGEDEEESKDQNKTKQEVEEIDPDPELAMIDQAKAQPNMEDILQNLQFLYKLYQDMLDTDSDDNNVPVYWINNEAIIRCIFIWQELNEYFKQQKQELLAQQVQLSQQNKQNKQVQDLSNPQDQEQDQAQAAQAAQEAQEAQEAKQQHLIDIAQGMIEADNWIVMIHMIHISCTTHW